MMEGAVRVGGECGMLGEERIASKDPGHQAGCAHAFNKGALVSLSPEPSISEKR